MDEIQILRKKLEREKKARKILENIIETRTRELYILNEELEKGKDDLEERLNEINGLYGLGKLTEKVDNLEELFHRFLKEIVPPSMRLPDKVYAKIEFDQKKYYSSEKRGLCNNNHCLSAPIKVGGKERGELSVDYAEDLPFIDKFEQDLINAYAERLGKIIERKEVEKMLAESEEMFRLVFENASDGILIADVEKKRFISANKRICEMTDYSLDEIIKLGVGDIHPKEDLPRVIGEFEKQVRGKKLIARDLPVLKKDGTIFYADIGSKSIIINGVNCSVGIFRDITERKILEEEKSKREKLEAISNIIVTLNHEMNQPLSVITSYAGYLMKNAKEDSKVYKDAKLISDEAWRLAEIVKKMSKLREIKTTEYSQGVQMIDIDISDINEKDENR